MYDSPPPATPEALPPPPPRTPPRPPPKGGGQGGAVVLALFAGLLAGGACASCLGGLKPGHDEVIAGGSERVGVVELTGMITDSGPVVRDLKELARRKDLAALVLRIDSPGGSVAPSQEIYEAVRAASKEKPVVASMGSVAASGAFWAAMAADAVYASPGSITGSIGVITQTPDLRGLAQLLRVDMRTFKSGPVKDLGNPLREVTPEDEAVFMGLIEDIYQQFVQVIAERRKMPVEEVKKLADGRIFTGRVAKGSGLVDELGDLTAAARKAVALAKERAGEKVEEDEEPTLVYPKRPMPGFLELLGQSMSRAAQEGLAEGVSRAAERLEARARWEVR